MKLLVVFGLVFTAALADRAVTGTSKPEIANNNKEKRTTAYSVYGPPANNNHGYGQPSYPSGVIGNYGSHTYAPAIEYSAPSTYAIAPLTAAASHGSYAVAAPYATPVAIAVPTTNYASVAHPLFYPSTHGLEVGSLNGYTAYPSNVGVYPAINGISIPNYPPAGYNFPPQNYVSYPGSNSYSGSDPTRLGPVTFGPGHGGAYSPPSFVAPSSYVPATTYETQSYDKPSSTYGTPSYTPSSSFTPSYQTPSSSYAPSYSSSSYPSSYPSSSYSSPSATYGAPAYSSAGPSYTSAQTNSYSPSYSSSGSSYPSRPSYSNPSPSYSNPSPTYGPPASPSTYGPPAPSYSQSSHYSQPLPYSSPNAESSYNTISYSSPTTYAKH